MRRALVVGRVSERSCQLLLIIDYNARQWQVPRPPMRAVNVLQQHQGMLRTLAGCTQLSSITSFLLPPIHAQGLEFLVGVFRFLFRYGQIPFTASGSLLSPSLSNSCLHIHIQDQ